MAKETNQILGHGADADGIEEYDNPLPDWWVGLYLLSIIVGVAYGINYHFIAQTSQEKQYLEEMAAAEERWPTPDGPAAFEMTDALVATGEGVFAQTCASCHNAAMTGGIGPNLIDEEWIHGSEPEAILAVITDGIADKGMPAWGKILGPQKVLAVAAYVVSKQGSTPAVAKIETPEVPEDPVASGPADGGQVYAKHCLACHGPKLKGLVGPNLVDDEWIHGGETAQIIATITNGVPEKGMVSWGPILSVEEIKAVAQFVQLSAQ